MGVLEANVQLAAFAAALALQYGLPALLNVLMEFQKKDPTMTDLVVLKSIPIDPDAKL
jgi:hypothetical protein